MAKKQVKKVTADAFFKLAIPQMRTEGYKGCHLIYSGLHTLIAKYFGWGTEDEDGNFQADKAKVREFVDKAVEDGVIAGHPVKGGFMVYLPQDAPAKTQNRGKLNKKAEAVMDNLNRIKA